jgi:intermediate peptidase
MKSAALIRRTAAQRQRARTQHIINTPASRPYHTSSPTKASPPSSSSSSFLESSNAAIKQAFDAPPAVFSLLESFQSTTPPAGRFGYNALRNPEDFVELSRRTQRRAEAIVSRILDYAQSTTPLNAAKQQQASSSSDTITYSRSHQDQVHDLLVQVKQVDRLSDLLCSVIDLAELVRNLDPNPDWIKHAEIAYQELCYYMNQLNTHVELYRVSSFFLTPNFREPKLTD